MSRLEMIESVSDTLHKMYYEDVEFFYGFLTQYANRKGQSMTTINKAIDSITGPRWRRFLALVALGMMIGQAT